MDSGAIRRRLGAGLAVLTASLLFAVAAPGSAQAAPAACAGRQVRMLPFSTGSVLVYKNGGRVCAVTVQKHPGTKRAVSVGVQARGHVAVRKSRKHTRSSPPVEVYAGHRCVRVSGSVGSGTYTSGWILC
ncbi:hypothetical protein ACF09K_06800 [Streptomyces sp. NPDC014882]|uniref:hypothetical protein n=1 Tax=Streptomyces sp. NPDC014882 TaxID=3364927 RepID=UPI0036F9BA02